MCHHVWYWTLDTQVDIHIFDVCSGMDVGLNTYIFN